jgi:hypothetical protein
MLFAIRHGGQVLVDTHLPLIPATQKPFEA